MRVRVLGAGIIGLSVAEELVRRGHDVEVVDRAPASGASHAAAGMLSPAAEVWHGETELLRLGRRSADLWPEHAARLGVSLHQRGTLLAAADHGDLQEVQRQVELVTGLGERAELLDRRAVIEHEPRLGRVVGGALLPDDHSVDPREVTTVLLARLAGRVMATPGPVRPDVTVLATGARLPAPYGGWSRPVRGEILRLRVQPDALPERTVRAWVHGEPVYVVPRRHGEVVVGATSQEHDGPPVVTVEGVARLLNGARRLIPGLDRAELVETLARDRPGSPDNLPLVGPTREPGVLLAAGHFRHGVLLAPLTAALIADHLETGHVELALDPRRLEPSHASSPLSSGARP